MERRFELFYRTLEKLGKAGVLADIILIGSWCLYFYRKLFREADSIPAIRTVDLDFLVPNPPKIKNKVDVSSLLEELGFVEEFSHLTGNSKFIHLDLEVEFIIPEKGRGTDGPHVIKDINVRAQGLRYVNLLQDHTIVIAEKGINVTIPEPSAFVLHKIQVSGKRLKPDKREKDLETAIGLGEYLITLPGQVEKMRNIFKSLPVPWKKEILGIAKKHSKGIYDVLSFE